MSATATTEETVMGQVIPSQHPAVVLKSHYESLRALFAVALIAIAVLAATVVIVANDDANAPAPQAAAKSVIQPQQLPAGTRFDGGPDEGTRGIGSHGITTGHVLPLGTRFDGGPDEGSRGPQADAQPATPLVIPMGPGGR
jgi:hypothetical protein